MYLAQLSISGERYAQAAPQLEAVLAMEGKAGAPAPAVMVEATKNLAYVYQQIKDPRALPTASGNWGGLLDGDSEGSPMELPAGGSYTV
jgi:hypothetical protein